MTEYNQIDLLFVLGEILKMGVILYASIMSLAALFLSLKFSVKAVLPELHSWIFDDEKKTQTQVQR